MARIITKDSKPGKGIEKDAPEKRRFFLFFEIFFDKFFKLIQLNFIYLLTLLPLIMGIYYSIGYIEGSSFISIIHTIPGTVLILISIFITGPATAGFTYVLRNMQRREHTWIFSDFFSHFAKNFKQGIIIGALDIAVYYVLYVAFYFYVHVMPMVSPEMGNTIPVIGSALIIALTVVYTWAHYYIYTMMVTFKLDFGKLFKNSVIFAIAKFPLNLLITAIIGAAAYLLIWSLVITPIIAGILIPIIALSFIGFVIVFSTYPTIDKNMLQKVNKRVLNTRG